MVVIKAIEVGDYVDSIPFSVLSLVLNACEVFIIQRRNVT
jgi:hypothetical protein